MTNRELQRKKKRKQVAENSSDTVVLTAAPVRISDTIKQFHPYKNEILNVVRMLSSIGVNHIIIAASLDLQRWKTFYGDDEWTEADVKVLLEGYRA
jgi:hypothetical protein